MSQRVQHPVVQRMNQQAVVERGRTTNEEVGEWEWTWRTR
jgi:hypothetical protein